MIVRVLGVGAAAPELRLRAADVGAAWGRGGRGEAAVCAPDEDTLTLAWLAADRALAAAGIEAGNVDALFWGTSRPPFAEGPSFAFLAASLSLAPTVGGSLCADPRMPEWRPWPRAPMRSPPDLRRSRWSSPPTRCGPVRAPASRRVAAWAQPRSVLAVDGPANATIGTRVTRTRPFLDRYRGDGEIDNRDMYDALPLPRGDLSSRSCATSPTRSRRVRRERVVAPRSGRPAGCSAGAPGARRAHAVEHDLRRDRRRGRGDRAARRDRRARRGRLSRSSAPGGRTTGVLVNAEAPVPGAAATPDALTGGRSASYAEALRARGNSSRSARRSRWACLPRARCSRR